MNRLRLNRPGTKLSMVGLKGMMTLEISPDVKKPLTVWQEFSKENRAVMIYPGQNSQNMIIQIPNSNAIRLVDGLLNHLASVEGNHKPGTEYGEFDHFISSLCDDKILVSKGLGSVSVVDTKSMQELGEVKNFFEFEGQITRPFAAASNRDFTKVVGASLTEENQYCLHYFEFEKGINSETKVTHQ